MRLVLAVIVFCACGSTSKVAVENRGGATSTSCDLPERLEFEARRYGNVDAVDADYQTWSPWRVGIQFPHRVAFPPGSHTRETLRGTIAMVGDEIVWNFDIYGYLDDQCRLDVATDAHESFHIEVDVHVRTGTIRSIDDVWLLGPPFPTKR